MSELAGRVLSGGLPAEDALGLCKPWRCGSTRIAGVAAGLAATRPDSGDLLGGAASCADFFPAMTETAGNPGGMTRTSQARVRLLLPS